MVEAEADATGPRPRWVVWRGTRRPVVAVDDEWQVDDEWWRDEVRRRYFALVLANGRRLTIFHDQRTDTWWTHT